MPADGPRPAARAERPPLPPDAPRGRKRAALLALAPAAVAVLFFANTIPGDFVFDDVILIERGAGLRDMDLRRIFLSNYWGPDREDRNWRPLTLLSYALNYRLGSGPASFHAVNVLLYAAVCALVHLVLVALLRDRVLAALGACLFAALPIHTEAVANIVGRAELLAALAILGAWFAAGPGGARSHPAAIAAVGLITFLGLCAKENTAVTPAVIVAAAWILRARIPWGAALSSACAIGIYFALREWLMGEHDLPITLVDNPLAFADGITGSLNAVRLLGLYMWKIVAPIHLAADYSFDQLPVLPLSSPLLWAQAAAVVALLGGILVLTWRRLPLLAFAPIFFLLTIAPTSNVLVKVGTIFGERLAFTPSIAWPLALCALAGTAALARHRPVVLAAMVFLASNYGIRSFVRNLDWAHSASMDIRMASDSPRSTRSQLKAAEGYVTLHRTAAPEERKELLEKAIGYIEAALLIHPENGWAMAKHGEILLFQEKFDEAEGRLTEAIAVMARQEPPQQEPLILRFRGQCRLRLEKYPEALADFTLYLEKLERRGSPPDGASVNFQALALAALGHLEEALRRFDAAVELSPEIPEIRSNRGFCRYKLGDRAGAISEYETGLEICRKKGLLFTPGEDCAYTFLLRIAQVKAEEALARRAAGDEAGASRLGAEVVRHRADAAELQRGGAGRRGP